MGHECPACVNSSKVIPDLVADALKDLVLVEEVSRHRVIGEEEIEEDQVHDGEDSACDEEPLPLVGFAFLICVESSKGEERRYNDGNTVTLESPFREDVTTKLKWGLTTQHRIKSHTNQVVQRFQFSCSTWRKSA